MIRHVVLMTFKEGTTPERVDNVRRAIDEFFASVDFVRALTHSSNLDLETRPPKATYAVVADFDSIDDCLRFDVVPEHDVVRDAVLPLTAEVLVADFEYEP